MSIRKKVGEWFSRAFPPQPELPTPLEQFHAEQAAEKAAVLAARIDYAQRLSPFVGKLVLVTGFGFDMNGRSHEEYASRIAADIRAKALPHQTAFRISVHLDVAGDDMLGAQQQSAYRLTELLQGRGMEHVQPTTIGLTDHDNWLAKIVSEAEATLKRDPAPDETTHTIGHIAVIHPLNASSIGIAPTPWAGEAFLLQNVIPQGVRTVPEYSWQTISTIH